MNVPWSLIGLVGAAWAAVGLVLLVPAARFCGLGAARERRAGSLPAAGAGHAPAPEGASRHALPSPGPARHPVRAAPAPDHPRLLMTSRFYSDGVVYVDDHIRRVTRRFDPPPDDDGWDAAAERLIRDLRD